MKAPFLLPRRAASRSSVRGSLASARAPRPPHWLRLAAEPWRAAGEYLSLQWHQSALRAAPQPGDGHPVIIFPGLATNGQAVAPLRRWCQAWGFAAYDWGRGFNTGPGSNADFWLRTLADDMRLLLDGHDQAPTLIGWSLGGLYARELAKQSGLAVRQVITIGTPFNGREGQTHAEGVYRLLNGHAALSPRWRRRLRTPPDVPTTSIYSKSDGIVAWQACRHDRGYDHVEDIEVQGSHLGMGWNEAVLRVVRDKLLSTPAE
jgi:pimeloyl-ACP methyl ester carboxylesterase